VSARLVRTLFRERSVLRRRSFRNVKVDTTSMEFPRLSGHHASNGYTITGLVLLAHDTVSDFHYTSETIESVSKALCDFGDVSSIYTAT